MLLTTFAMIMTSWVFGKQGPKVVRLPHGPPQGGGESGIVNLSKQVFMQKAGNLVLLWIKTSQKRQQKQATQQLPEL